MCMMIIGNLNSLKYDWIDSKIQRSTANDYNVDKK
jgi:hypothetical protein